MNIQRIAKQSLTPLQLELLKIFARDIPEADLIEIKKLLVQFFAQKAIDSADEVWEINSWTEEDDRRFLKEHLRTPYLGKK
jgi:hypothetical protein